MAAVRIENDAWIDGRYALLAELCGFGEWDVALIRCARIWSYCTDQNSDVLPAALIDAHIKHKGFAENMVTAKLAQKTKHGIRIKGATGRIEWLASKRKAAAKGGKKKAENALANASRLLDEKPSPVEQQVGRKSPQFLPSYSGSCSDSEEAEAEAEAEHQPPPEFDESEIAEGQARASDPARKVTAREVWSAWHASAQRAGHMFAFSEPHHAKDWAAVAAACNVKSKPALALKTLCDWYWSAPDGPIASGRVRPGKASPSKFAERVNSDLTSANEWLISRSPS